MIHNNTNYLLGLENFIYLTILIKKRQKTGEGLGSYIAKCSYFNNILHGECSHVHI